MAFEVADRVKITNQSSQHRNLLGTVEAIAAATAHGFNEVRLDGAPVGQVVKLADGDLKDSTLESPIEY